METKKLTKEKCEHLLKEIIEKKADNCVFLNNKEPIYYFNMPNSNLDFMNMELERLSRSEDPRDDLNEIIHRDLEFSYSCDVLQAELIGYVTEILEKKYQYTKEQIWEYIDFIDQWVADYCFAQYPEEYQNIPVPVVIALDTGDKNHAFSINTRETFCERSSLYWLAKQQGHLNELKTAIKLNVDSDNKRLNPFVKSVLEELDEYSEGGATCFLVTMGLLNFIQLKEVIQSEKQLNTSLFYDKRTGSKTITVSKDSPCGLYCFYSGGGSLFGIELSKDVVIPTKAIFDAWIDTGNQFGGCNGRGYDISCCYGMAPDGFSGSCRFEV